MLRTVDRRARLSQCPHHWRGCQLHDLRDAALAVATAAATTARACEPRRLRPPARESFDRLLAAGVDAATDGTLWPPCARLLPRERARRRCRVAPSPAAAVGEQRRALLRALCPGVQRAQDSAGTHVPADARCAVRAHAIPRRRRRAPPHLDDHLPATLRGQPVLPANRDFHPRGGPCNGDVGSPLLLAAGARRVCGRCDPLAWPATRRSPLCPRLGCHCSGRPRCRRTAPPWCSAGSS
mmetsp:Transcript_13575/g.34870  ORF Transcript_13575/g.34870 Transcript_13575/m.34870 type:complete len:239 (-) Transcript_13575:1424-2140(-)